MLNKRDEKGHSYLTSFPILERKHLVFYLTKNGVSFKYLLSVLLPAWGNKLLFLVCCEFLLWMVVDFWQLYFLHLLKWWHWLKMVFINLLIQWISSNCFSNSKPTLHSCDKTNLLMLCYPFHIIHCWILSANILLRTFSTMFVRSTGL